MRRGTGRRAATRGTFATATPETADNSRAGARLAARGRVRPRRQDSNVGRRIDYGLDTSGSCGHVSTPSRYGLHDQRIHQLSSGVHANTAAPARVRVASRAELETTT